MKKLKQQYRHAITHQQDQHTWVVYPYFKSRMFRRFSTKQEKSAYQLHQFEYAKSYALRLRTARGPALASAWDDHPIMAYVVAKSWKHNAKRAKQYHRHTQIVMAQQ